MRNKKIVDLELDNSILDKLDLTQFDKYLTAKMKDIGGYDFYGKSGKEHYRLLSHISNTFDNITILDVGTYNGGSAMALSTNQKNKVISVDIEDRNQTIIDVPNIEFYVGDITEAPLGYELIQQSDIILYDTVHDGKIETEFHKLLLKLNWNGIVIWDDIKLRWNGEKRIGMINFWNNITNQKFDITKYAHWTGTGIVSYGDTILRLKLM